MDAEILELCKENVQPLKQGRSARKLGLALLAQTDDGAKEQLAKEREDHELAIMTYDGADPLEPRYEYVHWVEQSCPKHGREANLIPLLEDTIMMFKEDERYKQDTRFIELIIKYIETQDNPVELYQMVYAQGLGTQCASFYKAWADQLDMNNDLQRANQVFQLALSNGAEPKEVVDQAHMIFQMSVGRRMMTGQLSTKDKSVSNETAERQRHVLGKIKKGGSLRPSSGLPGRLPLTQSNKSGNASSGFAVYQEDDNGIPIGKTPKSNLRVNQDSSRKENTRKPAPWNQGFKHRDGGAVAQHTNVHSTPSFKVLEDEEEEIPREFVPATPVPTNVLKTRKAEFKQYSNPEELFKSPHPNLKSHLPVFEAFAGGTEFSFEELRWVYLSKKKAQMKSGSLDATPMKGVTYFEATPCKSTTMTPIGGMTPQFNSSKFPVTPATNRGIYPIPESPPLNPEENPSSHGLPEIHRLVGELTKPNSDEIGVYAIPSTPAGCLSSSSTQAMDTPSTSRNTPLISRPRIPKPPKSEPFKIFTDD